MTSIFKLDLRSLSLVRFLLGILAFWDIASRMSQVDIFYSDKGILPRWVLFQQFDIPWRTGLFYLNGDANWIYLVSIVGLISCVFFAVGLKTRLANFLTWLVLMSFHARFPEVNHGGDNLLRLMFFISFFLPMNAYGSFDLALFQDKNNHSIDRKDHHDYFSVFTVSWVMLILSMYWFTFYYKWTPTWFKDYDSVYYALSLDMFSSAFGDMLLPFKGIMKFMSFYAFWLEGIGPFLLLIAFKRDLFRGIAVFLFWGLHAGIWATMILGNFPPGCMIIWCALIPSSWWNKLGEWLIKYQPEAIKLYYDVDCGFCRKFCLILKEILFLKNVEILPSNQDKKIHQIIKLEKTWALEINGNIYKRFQVLEILLRNSKLFIFNWIYLLKFSKWGGDLIYSFISKGRYYFGVALNQIGYSPIKLELSKTANVFGIVFIIISFLWNVEGTKAIANFKLKSPIDELAFTFQWNQQWNMFAPRPMRNDGWFIVDATLQDGVTRWDILNDQAYSEDRPKELADMYPTHQVRKFLVNLYAERNETYMLWFGRYLCRKWNARQDRPQVKNYQLIFMRELTVAPDEEAKPIEKVVVWNHQCFK